MGGATRFLMLLTTSTTPAPLILNRYSSLLRLSRHRRQILPSFLQHHNPIKIRDSRQLHIQSSVTTPTAASNHFSDSSVPRADRATEAHSWPEWSNLINNLSLSGYFNKQIRINDELIDGVNLPQDFISAVSACFAFALEKPHLLGLLPRRDIEVVVHEGMPFLFKSGDDSKRRMMAYLGIAGSNVQNTDRACTIDLVRFLLSHVSHLVSSEKNNQPSGEIDSSIRHLLGELAKLSHTPQTYLSGSVQNQLPDRYGQAPRPSAQNIEMKRGDWICPRCSFMNFARNMRCRDCDEARPKRQLTGGEWECPQCDFFNYGKNIVCLRCDCKRPGEVSFGAANASSGLGYGNGSNANRADVDSRLAANEEKAQRWFSKISQMDSNSDMSTIADEDFPEIMPLRKGVNRFVVSTRKTPLERRLSNAEYRRNLDSSGSSESTGVNVKPDQSINLSLDEILGRKTATSETDDKNLKIGQNVVSGTSTSSPTSPQYSAPRGSSYVPFVPLPEDMFAKKTDKPQMDEGEMELESRSLASRANEQTASWSREYSKSSDSRQASENLMDPTLINEKEKEQADKSERWLKRVAELHDVKDLAGAISDEDFPEIMPMRKGENRFVVSKRKDRSLTSPMYKRQMAMDQANDTNFVPFVPFPPNYFAQKNDQQSGGANPTNTPTSGNSTPAAPVETEADASYGALTSGNSDQIAADPRPNSWSNGQENIRGTSNLTGSSTQNYTTLSSGKDGRNNEFAGKENVKDEASLMGATATSDPSKSQNIRGGWSGKSLEGSAVKEPDPLDMSEEAKAERWFRRVAQINDISELSQIPDEDFPSIMPMRKGVNRFVVSKRKTPLERRLTSTQYRRNLPTVNSDPIKESDDS
ncbi:zinc finger protein VAR3, chloroplastic [Mercurialis annua]|uniref:zinc finger protein VAR3, chloroplastic n=1 Tax=Mercurialis annua TaxID=3986 RepID=UPI00215FA9A8|nr:zinc finger protein VAR3, chloroplastic [Mercurialis annua]